MQNKYYQYILPMNVGTIIPKDSIVFLIEKIIYLFDLSALYKNKNSNAGRKPKIPRERLLMIIIYAYLEGIFSSRDIAEKLRRDINYMYLAENQILSHDKINKFRQSLKDGVFLNFFKQFVMMLNVIKEIEFETVYIDGTKIEANANRYSFVWARSVSKNEAKLQVNVKKLIREINGDQSIDSTFIFDEEEKISAELMYNIILYLNNYAEKHKIEFKYGKGRRKPRVQKYIEELENYLTRQSNYDFANSVFEGRNSYSKTDPKATFMRMKEDHMKNGQLKAAYNVQVAMEGGYVVGVGLFNNRNDVDTLIPLLDKMHDMYGVNFTNCVTDSGYFSEENITELEDRKMNYYIPYQSYYTEQTKKFKNKIGRYENMTFDKERNVYLCANNRELIFMGVTQGKKNSGFYINKLNYKSQGCEGCHLRKKCMPRSKNEDATKCLSYSGRFENQKRKALKNIKSEEGIRFRVNRSIQVEGYFGNLKQNYHFRRFMLRGTDGVELEMLLLAFAYNVKKLYKNIKSGKIGSVTMYEVNNKKAA